MKRYSILAFLAACTLLAGTTATAQTNSWQEQQRRQQQEQMRQQQQEQARRQQLERDRQAQMEQARREEQARQTRTQHDQARRQMETARQAQQAGRPAPGGTPQAVQNRTSDRMVFSNGVAKLTRPLTNDEVKRGFTGKLTSDGRALVKFQGRVFAVPAARVGVRPLLSSSSPTALASTWSPQKQASINSEVQKLAAGSGGSAAAALAGAPNTRLEVAKLAKYGIQTPFGSAFQSSAPAALQVRRHVANGGTIYRVGTTNKSTAAEAQFWAPEHPSTPGFAKKYGIPEDNVKAMNFIAAATVKPGVDFITREAPGVGENTGNGIEIVVPEGGVLMKSFSHKGN